MEDLFVLLYVIAAVVVVDLLVLLVVAVNFGLEARIWYSERALEREAQEELERESGAYPLESGSSQADAESDPPRRRAGSSSSRRTPVSSA